jgi:esterase/lipase superfamily enzyme
MQQMDNNEKISSFIFLEDFANRRLTPATYPGARRIGDDAVYAVLCPSGEVVVGSREELRPELTTVFNQNEHYRFLNLSIAKFLRNEAMETKAAQAIRNAEQYERKRLFIDGEEPPARVKSRTSHSPQRHTVHQVFFATNRQQSGRLNPYFSFSGRRSGEVVYGAARVSLPTSRLVGMIPRSTEMEQRHYQRIDRSSYFVIESLTLSSGADDLLRDLSGIGGGESLLIFVHGYRQSMGSALLHSAQLAEDLRFSGPILAFCWPSGQPFSYNSKGVDIDFIDDLGTCLRDICATSSYRRIILLAHGSGCQLLIPAINANLSASAMQVDEIVLASPDMQVSDFLSGLKSLSGTGNRITVYSSKRDKALALSGTFFRQPVAGSNPQLLIGAGADVIDTSSANSPDQFDFLRHSDFSSVAVRDLKALITERKPVAERGLERVEAQNGEYWRLASSNG